MSLAHIILPSQNFSLAVAITSYSYDYNGTNQSAQKRLGLDHFPIRINQSNFNFVIQCNSEAQWQLIKKMIKAHQEDVLKRSITSDGFFRILWDEQDIDYTVLIKNAPGGAVRFQTSPNLSISTEFIYDNIFSVSNEFFDPGTNFNILSGVVDSGEFIKPVNWKEPKPKTIKFSTGVTGVE